MRFRLFRAPLPERIPKRPYRDTALYYAALAVCLVAVAYLTGGSVQKAIVVGVAFFVIATAWGWRVWRKRIALEEETEKR